MITPEGSFTCPSAAVAAAASAPGGGSQAMTAGSVFKRIFLFLFVVAHSAAGLSSLLLAPSFAVAAPVVADATTETGGECREPGTCVDGSMSPRGRSWWSRWWPWRQGAGDDAADAGDPSTGASDARKSSDDGDAPSAPREQRRLVSPGELARHVGEDGAPIWLSILGEVFDVSAGADFYGNADGKGGSYSFYAGRDASPCFSTGKNDPEGAAERLEEWDDHKLAPVWEWTNFYHQHEVYEYLGVLAGSRYYDEAGNETELRKDIVLRAKKAMAAAEEAKMKRRLERRAAREKKKKK